MRHWVARTWSNVYALGFDVCVLDGSRDFFEGWRSGFKSTGAGLRAQEI